MTPPSSTSPTAARLRRLREGRAARWALDAVLILGVLLAVGAFQTRRHLSGSAAPAVTLPSLSGERVSLESLRGRPTLVVFWAPWCPVCKASSGNASWVRRLAGDRVNVVSIAAAYDSVDDVRAYVREQGVDYPVLLGDDDVARAFRVDSYPTYYFLDADGRVKRSAAGYTTTLGMLVRLVL